LDHDSRRRRRWLGCVRVSTVTWRIWKSFGQGSLPPTARREPFNKGEADEDYRKFTGARADYLVPPPLSIQEKLNNHDSIFWWLTGLTNIPREILFIYFFFEGNIINK
jgi:hypothetical protein